MLVFRAQMVFSLYALWEIPKKLQYFHSRKCSQRHLLSLSRPCPSYSRVHQVNPSRPSGVIWHLTSCSTNGSGNSLAPEPLLTLCQSNLQEQTPLKFYSKYNHFHSTKCSWKCRLQNTNHCVQAPWVINGKQYWICIVYHPWLAVVDFFFSCLSTCLHKVYVFGWWPRHNWHRFSWQKYTAHYMMKMSLHQYDISTM